jgi:hypothetical protein
MPHLAPVLDNLFQLLQLSGGAVFVGPLDDHVGADFCALCNFIRMEWPRLVQRINVRRNQFTTHLGCVVIPFNKNEVAYLSLRSPYEVQIKPYDAEALAAALRGETDYIEPGLLKKARTLTSAVFDWAKAGFPMATQEQIDARLALCKACEFWEPNGYLHLGKCKKCGCSGAKLNLATSTCPEGKWNAVNNS